MNERWRPAVLLAVATAVYGNTLLNGFTFDDELYIFRNKSVVQPSLAHLFEVNRYTNVLRPLTFGTFSLNWAAGGHHPLGFHLGNLLLHGIVTLILYFLLQRLLDGCPQGAVIAFVSALLFAVHPIHTEAVASIVGRSELLAAGFLFGAWAFHLRDRVGLTLVCYVLALLSKEPAVVFLPLVVAGDFARGQWKPIRRYGWIAVLTLVYLGVLWKLQGGGFGPKDISFLDNPLARLPAKLRILNACRVAWKYIGLHVFPSQLSCDYSYNSILLYSNWRHTALWAIAALLLTALWIWALVTKKHPWALAGTIYIVGFSVTANILVPGGTILGERLAYLPSAGFCLLVGLLWVRLEGVHKAFAWGALAVVLALLAARTVMRNRDWRDDFNLYSAAVRVVPRSAKMHANLGAEYMYRAEPDLARKEFETALRIFPDFPEAIEWLGLLEANMGHNEAALRLLRQALSEASPLSVNHDFDLVNLAAQLIKTGQYEEALGLLGQAIAEAPENARAWSNRAVIHYHRGESSAARTDAQAALRLDPSNAQARGVLTLLSESEVPPR